MIEKIICVIMDSDGHFDISDITNREETIKLLKRLHDGDYWANEADGCLSDLNIENETDLLKVGPKSWLDFINCFQQRGTMELKTIVI